MVRTYEDAVIVFSDGTKKDTNLDDFFDGGLRRVLLQCPPGAYSHKHEKRGIFDLHCRICLEHGCTNTKFQRISQIDQHKKRFHANLMTAHFKHSPEAQHHDDCYCPELKQISNSAANTKVRAIHSQIYLVAEQGKEIRFFLKARKPDELGSQDWALVLSKLIRKMRTPFQDKKLLRTRLMSQMVNAQIGLLVSSQDLSKLQEGNLALVVTTLFTA